MEVTTTVKLAVYDLSHGMAAQMSTAMIGQRIDGIWHTGVIVYGREYFFGGGIQHLPIGEFSRGNGLNPVTVLEIGHTELSSDVFHEYLHSISSRFSASTYDLINNNCNNFSHECTQFLTGCGIPAYIIDLPKIVFSTPQGALLRPMIENMQNGVRGGSGPVDPFGTSFQSTVPAPAQNIVPAPACKMECTSPAPAPAEGCGKSECGGRPPECKEHLLDAATYLPQEVIIVGPLKSQNKDCGLLKKVGEKFRNTKYVDGSGASKNIVTCAENRLLQDALETLRAKPTEGSVAFPEEVYTTLLKIITDHPGVQCACFYVLQLLVLVDSNINCCFLVRVVQSIAHIIDPQTKHSYEMSGPARFFAVCSMTNYFCRVPKIASCPKLLVPMLNVILDLCTFYISKEYTYQSYRPELRQWTAALLHNILLFQLKVGGWNTTDEIHPHLVQIICGVVEDIIDEPDVVVLHRRLSVAHNIILNFPATRELFRDLGFIATYGELKRIRAGTLNVLVAAVDETLKLVVS